MKIKNHVKFTIKAWLCNFALTSWKLIWSIRFQYKRCFLLYCFRVHRLPLVPWNHFNGFPELAPDSQRQQWEGNQRHGASWVTGHPTLLCQEPAGQNCECFRELILDLKTFSFMWSLQFHSRRSHRTNWYSIQHSQSFCLENDKSSVMLRIPCLLAVEFGYIVTVVRSLRLWTLLVWKSGFDTLL